MIRIEIDRLQLRLKASELDRLAALLREMERVESERAIGAPRRSSMVSLVVVPGLSLRLSYREIMELRSLIDDARSKLLRQRSHPWPTEFLN